MEGADREMQLAPAPMASHVVRLVAPPAFTAYLDPCTIDEERQKFAA